MPQLVRAADVTDHVRQLLDRVAQLEARATSWDAFAWGAWATVASGVGFVNSWADVGGGFQTARYRSNAYQVEIQGHIKSGNIGTTAFTLPSGYRPAATLRFGSYGADNGANQYPVMVSIDNTGAVGVNLELAYGGGPSFTNPALHAAINVVFGLGS